MEDEWQPKIAFWPITLNDGSTVKPGNLVMRKKISGDWRYRKPTVEDAQRLLEDNA